MENSADTCLPEITRITHSGRIFVIRTVQETILLSREGEKQMNILLIGHSGRFRDGLEVVLAAHPQVQTIRCVDNITAGTTVLWEEQRPLLIIVDGNHSELESLDNFKHYSQPEPPWIFIADTLQHQEAAYAAGADAVLLRGFSKATLKTTLNRFTHPIPACTKLRAVA